MYSFPSENDIDSADDPEEPNHRRRMKRAGARHSQHVLAGACRCCWAAGAREGRSNTLLDSFAPAEQGPFALSRTPQHGEPACCARCARCAGSSNSLFSEATGITAGVSYHHSIKSTPR